MRNPVLPLLLRNPVPPPGVMGVQGCVAVMGPYPIPFKGLAKVRSMGNGGSNGSTGGCGAGGSGDNAVD